MIEEHWPSKMPKVNLMYYIYMKVIAKTRETVIIWAKRTNLPPEEAQLLLSFYPTDSVISVSFDVFTDS